MAATIRFTQITSKNCALTKTFGRNEHGALTSSAIAHMSEGAARIVEINELSQLGTVLPLLQPNQAITCGLPIVGDTSLTTRVGQAFRHDAVARTNETFAFSTGPALFAIDVDIDTDAFKTVSHVMDALETCSPWLRHIHRVARPSASSFVAGKGLRGVHAYFVVTRGTDIPALATRMQTEQWLAGRGYVKISKSGALLVRQLFDASVYQPSRLIFEAQAVLENGVERIVPPNEAFMIRAPELHSGAPVHYKTPEGHLDVSQLPKLREVDARRFTVMVRAAKDARRREAKRIAIDYQVENAIAQGFEASDGERRGVIASRALGDKQLPSTWEVMVKGLGRVTVADILAGMPHSLGHQCADPFDTWREDHTDASLSKAEIVTMGDKPGIWSHKLQEFFAFTTDSAANLSTPLELAAERLCGAIEYPEDMGKGASSELNVAHALTHLLAATDYELRYNQSTYKLERDGLPDDMALKYALARVGCVRVNKNVLENAIGDVARANPYDPWKDVVLSLPQWDKVPRLDTFFSDICDAPPSDALTFTTQLLFAGVIMRQLEPGITCPVIPVLIGDQNAGKSRFVAQFAAALKAPAPASITFSDDIRMSMAASLSVVAELAEMSGMGRREVEDIKRWLTDDIDTYRAPYERHPTPHPRRFVLIGTANQHEINRDATGNRRMMPVHVLRPIDAEWSIECPQLLAEAKARFCQSREEYMRLVGDAARSVGAHNKDDMRRGVGTITSALDDLLPPILRTQMRMGNSRRVSSAAIRHALDMLPSGRQQSAQLVSSWLLTRGWQVGKDGAGLRYYKAPDDFEAEDNDLTYSAAFPITKP